MAKHPAIEAYEALRSREPNEPYLQFALLQQMWVRARGKPSQRPDDYSIALLRTMAFALLISQGYSEQEIRAQLIDIMEQFEHSYTSEYERLREQMGATSRPKKMRRTKQAGKPTNNVVLFPGVKRIETK